jgi:hypothetical protein
VASVVAGGIVRRFGYVVVGSGHRREVGQHRLHPVGSLPTPYADAHRSHPTPFELDLTGVTTPCGFSYDETGWHPYVAALEEHLAAPDLPYERTILARYYARFRPTNVQEVLLEDAKAPLAPLDRWPPVPKLYKQLWTLNPRRLERILRDSGGWARDIKQHIGPQSAAQAGAHLSRIVTVYDSVRRDGYRPDAYRDGIVTGYFLEADGDYRFMVVLGNHRLAAFRAAGVRRVLARFHPGHPPVINASRIDEWCRRSGSVLSPEVARAVFEKLFAETGTTKARTLGII